MNTEPQVTDARGVDHPHSLTATQRGLPRRRLLGAGLALGSLAAAGCATSPSRASIGHVVVLGGGFGGATAAHYLRRWGAGAVDVTLVERNAGFVSCPISNLVVGGYRGIDQISRSYDGLRKAGVRVIQGEALAIDAAARTLRMADGSQLKWDRLVVSPGVDFMLEQVGGLKSALDSGQVLHAWKAGPQTLALRAQLEAMRPGGVFAISIPKAPYRCPPGPYERASVVASFLKTRNPRAKVLVFDANPEIQSKKALFERAFAEYPGMLEYKPNSELREVAGNTARFEFEDVRADVLNVIAPQRAADIAVKAGLVNINQRWAGVNWLTMESTAVPGVHVLGDATFSAPLMPKSGHMANQHAKVAAAAIIALMRGEPVNTTPVVMNTCYSFVNGRDVVHVASVHQYDAADKTFKTVPGSGGVSTAASELEGRYALSWAENIWADMLG